VNTTARCADGRAALSPEDKNPSQIMTFLSLAGMLALVLFPVLIPAIITAVHIFTGQARTSTLDRVAASFPRRTASPRFAVPAMA
jgi:hypothetical protein